MPVDTGKGQGSGGNNLKLYEGVGLVDVININEFPNIVYTSVNNGVKEAKLGFTVQHPLFKSILWFALANAETPAAKTGTLQFIDIYGKSSWGKDIESLPKHIDKTTARRTLIGEADLIKFLLVWLNIKKGAYCQLDRIQDYFKGDFSEIQEFIDNRKNKVFVLFQTYQKKEGNEENPTFKQGVSTEFFDYGWKKIEDDIKYQGVRSLFLKNQEKSTNTKFKDAKFDFHEYGQVVSDTLDLNKLPSSMVNDDLPF